MMKGLHGLFLSLTVLAVNGQAQNYSLQECRQMAIQNNKELKIGQEKINQEGNRKKAAFTKFLPEFSFSGTYTHNSKNISMLAEDAHLPVGTMMDNGKFGFRTDQVKGTTVNGTWVPLDKNNTPFNPYTNPEKIVWNNYALIPKEAFEFDIKDVYAGIFNVTQPLYMGGKIKAYNDIAHFAEELAKQKQNTNVQDLILKTDETYWQVVSLIHKKKLAESYVKLLQKMDSDVTNMIQSGVSTKADGLTVKVKLNEAETTLSKIENGLSLCRMQLCQICGIDLQSKFSLKDETLESEPQPFLPSIDLNLTYAQRSELKTLEWAEKIYRKKETIAKAEHLPQIALTGNYMLSNPNSYNGYENKFAGMWNVGVIMRIPIFHWGEHAYNLKIAKSETQIIGLQLNEAKEKIELQLNQAQYKVNESAKRLANGKKNMERADENLRYATIGFESGVIPASSLLEAQTAWLSSFSEKIDAEIEVQLCKTYFEKASGGIHF